MSITQPQWRPIVVRLKKRHLQTADDDRVSRNSQYRSKCINRCNRVCCLVCFILYINLKQIQPSGELSLCRQMHPTCASAHAYTTRCFIVCTLRKDLKHPSVAMYIRCNYSIKLCNFWFTVNLNQLRNCCWVTEKTGKT